MADTVSPEGGPQDRRQNVRPTTMTAWVGIVAFAGAAMFVLGIFHAIAGFVALFREEYYQVGSNELDGARRLVDLGHGIHLIGGVVIIAAGIGLFTGQVWARIVAVILAMVSAVLNIGFLAAYPVWGVVMITLDLLVIWAVMVHGDEVRQ